MEPIGTKINVFGWNPLGFFSHIYKFCVAGTRGISTKLMIYVVGHSCIQPGFHLSQKNSISQLIVKQVTTYSNN